MKSLLAMFTFLAALSAAGEAEAVLPVAIGPYEAYQGGGIATAIDSENSVLAAVTELGTLRFYRYDRVAPASYVTAVDSVVLDGLPQAAGVRAAVDSQDHLHVFWLRLVSPPTTYALFYTRVDRQGSVLVAPVQISPNDNNAVNLGNVAVNAAGDAFLTWTGYPNPFPIGYPATPDGRVTRVLADGSVQPAQLVASASWSSWLPIVAVSPADEVFVVFGRGDAYGTAPGVGYEGTDIRTYVQKLDATGAPVWPAPALVVSGVNRYYAPSYALSFSADATRLNIAYSSGRWTPLPVNILEVYALGVQTSTGQVPPGYGVKAISVLDGFHDYGVAIQTDADDETYVVWNSTHLSAPDPAEVHYRVLDGTFASVVGETRLTNNDVGNVVLPDIHRTSDDQILWSYTEGTEARLVLGVTAGCPDVDGDGHDACSDCDDNDPSVGPDAMEVCDGKDNNCDGQCDEDLYLPEECTTVQRGTFGVVEDADVAQDYGTWAAGAYPILSTGFSPNPHRVLTRYDVGFVPTGAIVTSAAAAWFVGWNEHTQLVRLHRALAPWSEATVSWNNWSAPSNYDPAVLGSFTAFGGSAFVSVDLTAMYQGIVDGQTPDHGVLLESDVPPESPGNKYLYVASESSNLSRRPKLDICWMPLCNLGCNGP